MNGRSLLGLTLVLGGSACVVGQGHGDGAVGKGSKSSQAGTSRDGGSGSGGRTGVPEGSGGASAGASGTSGAGARAAGSGGTELDSGAGGNPSAGASDGGRGAARDASTATPNDAGAATDNDAECAPVMVAVCNPVTNEGCLDSLAMQCAVDYASTLTGYCIFYSGDTPTPGVECFNSGVTESCPPTQACVDGECRELCLCNADCEAGKCCKDRLESTGFKVCGAC